LPDFWLPVLSDSFSQLPLDAARQRILPLGGDEGVFASHLEIAMAGDL
jgi:hypothetical protein